MYKLIIFWAINLTGTLSPLKLHLPSSNGLPGRAVVTDEPGSAEESGTSSQSDLARHVCSSDV